MSVRKKAVLEGRAFVRVRVNGTGEPTTVGVCPACWNSPGRRPSLLAKLSRMGLESIHGEDALDGAYRDRSTHAPGCPYGHIVADPRDRFRGVLKGVRKNEPGSA